MPLRDYQCTACETQFEVLERDPETAVCPACGSKELQRQFSFPANYSIKGNNSGSTSPKGKG